MKVLKFGGSSVGSAEGIRNIENILRSESGRKIVVVSAMAGVTNKLLEVAAATLGRDYEVQLNLLSEIEHKHLQLISALFETGEDQQIKALFLETFERLKNAVFNVNFSEAEIVTFGETFLSLILSHYLRKNGLFNTWLNAQEFMKVSNVENPDILTIRENLIDTLHREEYSELYITQGFVRMDSQNRIATLNRGGSDYSAAIIGAAIKANAVEIWTDIDGFHNNDPRLVENTCALTHLTFEEAAELAYFGAKILHPQTVTPVQQMNIPIYLKNTFRPEAAGTCISNNYHRQGLKAISAKDGITAIKIKSNRMLMAHGFLKKIFEVFDKFETAIDMITTSEIAISLTIDDSGRLSEIVKELKQYGEISIDQEHSIICVVGEGVINDKETFKLFELLNDLPVRMISYGGSSNNISLLVATENKVQAVQLLHQKLFKKSLIEID